MADSTSLLTLLEAEAAVIGLLALLFAAVWVRSRDRGLMWLSVGFALAALWYAYSGRLPESGPDIDSPTLRLWSIVIGMAVLCVSTGVVRYLGLPRGAGRWLVLACGVPGLVMVLALGLGFTLSHRAFHVGVLVAYLGAATLALQRAREAPGDGHALLGLTLLTLALMPHAMAYAEVPPDQLKYFAGLLLGMFGMVLLTVSLLRRQRSLEAEVRWRGEAEAELREANLRLEARVNERTAHLRELIGGLESFNRGVSHDLRGPLGGMSSLARLAADALARGDDSVATRVLPVIARQCDDSVQMVTTMLALARLGDLQVQPQPVCLTELARSAFDEVLLSQAGARRPELHCGEMPQVQADPRLLRPILVNLIGNAMKFSRHASSPRIEIVASVVGRDVEICVDDNGPGFPPELAERIFEPFCRAHGAGFEGHGLGLSIVRRAVDAMGGSVRALTRPGGGASIRFSLPGAIAEQAAPSLAQGGS